VRRITEIFAEADAKRDEMGVEEFVRRLHAESDEQDEDFTRLKETLELGFFTELYNASGKGRRLVWARANPRRSGHADFTVWSDDQKWCRDLELTSVWADEDDFPKMPGQTD
jgi:hypothetical protein